MADYRAWTKWCDDTAAEREDEMGRIEMENLCSTGGRAPPLWSMIPELRGMTRATLMQTASSSSDPALLPPPMFNMGLPQPSAAPCEEAAPIGAAATEAAVRAEAGTARYPTRIDETSPPSSLSAATASGPPPPSAPSLSPPSPLTAPQSPSRPKRKRNGQRYEEALDRLGPKKRRNN